jgi:hypothetical protein
LPQEEAGEVVSNKHKVDQLSNTLENEVLMDFCHLKIVFKELHKIKIQITEQTPILIDLYILLRRISLINLSQYVEMICPLTRQGTVAMKSNTKYELDLKKILLP